VTGWEEEGVAVETAISWTESPLRLRTIPGRCSCSEEAMGRGWAEARVIEGQADRPLRMQ